MKRMIGFAIRSATSRRRFGTCAPSGRRRRRLLRPRPRPREGRSRRRRSWSEWWSEWRRRRSRRRRSRSLRRRPRTACRSSAWPAAACRLRPRLRLRPRSRPRLRPRPRPRPPKPSAARRWAALHLFFFPVFFLVFISVQTRSRNELRLIRRCGPQVYFGDCSRDSSLERTAPSASSSPPPPPPPPEGTGDGGGGGGDFKGRLYERGAALEQVRKRSSFVSSEPRIPTTWSSSSGWNPRLRPFWRAHSEGNLEGWFRASLRASFRACFREPLKSKTEAVLEGPF